MTNRIHAYQQQADRRRRDELILGHLPLVKHVIGRLIGELPAGVDVENLEAAGVLGLVESATKFDPTRNAKFQTFAYLRIRGAVVDELRRNSPLPQHVHVRVAAIRRAHRTLPAPVTVEALAEATGLTPDEVSDTLAAERFAKTTSWEQVAEPGGLEPASTAGSPHDDIERWEATKQLADAIEALPENERLVVTLYYREDLRLKEISEVLKLSISRISRILTKATFELGEALRSRLGPQAVREGC
ncbi:rna sigma 28 : RNA polymerase sigma factor for flagellar operon FliA OS=uncultured planctomycete GN=HGMM_F11F07C13 PE=4 SV=1: Sigma70_r2: Sigma70_r4 [Gemmataceae bacterium]|nr:rna sigma 28 : RNA polymerase sigma factor for flagellar operon FliA OS=uncultured planctomycete GN=HGMM_F11F07C13 PE=4 SV=1: Sigma70_r2: Sigma70_r4 [Gemmataceae bacterium]VTT97907.1 rna sigma 28 : RNA polymerase sigma factor for flagellar operon FliA OS=uncultured planctomycete GN=HGMM_F11F07C13 PE=4 SV=1: Sigma70_r2: Sigma70_r4 [Gemmataceae bacterium]